MMPCIYQEGVKRFVTHVSLFCGGRQLESKV